MPRRPAAKKKPPTDSLSELADEMATAAETMTAGQHEADASSAGDDPAPDSFAHYVHRGSYLLTYGVMFPALMFAMSISANNSAARGGGARAKAKNSKKRPAT
jgi:hypothetical protein